MIGIFDAIRERRTSHLSDEFLLISDSGSAAHEPS